MPQITLTPDREHCIETTARNRFNKAVKTMLTKPDNARLTARAELLRDFLKIADFKRLRAESEYHILRGQRVKFVITGKKGEITDRMIIE